MTEDHTLEHYRTDFWFPKLLDRSNYESWVAGGKKKLNERLEEKMKHILETHHPPPIDDAVMREMKKIIDKADKNAS